MPRDRELLFGAACAVVAAGLFALLGPLSRFAAQQGVEAAAFTAWRAGLGTLALAGLVLVRGEAAASARSLRGLTPAGRGSLAVASLLGVALNVSIFTAFGRIPIALALMLFYTYPAGVAAIDILLGRERLTAVRIAALALASAGVVLVLAGGLDPAGLAPDALGIGLALVAAACQVAFVTISRTGYRSVPADVATMVILAASLAGGMVVALAIGQGAALAAPLETPMTLPSLIVAGVVSAALASVLFITAIRRIGGTRTGILMLLEPVVGVLLAGLLLGESLAPIQALGGLLVLAGALVLQVASPPELEPIVEEAAGPIV